MAVEPETPGQEAGPTATRSWITVPHILLLAAVVLLPLLVGAVVLQSVGGTESSTTSEGFALPPGSSVAPTDSPGDTTTPTSQTVSVASTTTVTSAAPVNTSTTTLPTPVIGRPFADTSPFNSLILDNPVLDPRSDRIVDMLTSEVVADLYEFGIAIYEVDSSITPVAVDCTKRWGRCPLETGLHRIPEYAEPAPGNDGTLVVIDWQEHRTVEMWQPTPEADGSWTTSWGTTTPIDGSGVPTVFGNGAGISHLAGVIRVEEIEQGIIDHALVFSTSEPCLDEFRYPATKTDGSATSNSCIPEGARIRLNPTIDLNTLRLTPGERIIAEALQGYGAYAVDTGGTAMAFYFEIADDATAASPGSVYTDAGLTRDYSPLRTIPWDELQVLNAWDGS
jgi:hypothetical protein